MPPKTAGNPIVINEYGWLWLNRDGTPTTLTSKLYENLLGSNSTESQRRHLYALCLAAETEFWRSGRACAAVMHFTALGYSRHDGQTSDHWKPGGVKTLEWEPEFYRYVRDAFAPVGLNISFWKDKVLSRTQSHIPIILINDLEQSWQGQITLRLTRDGNRDPLIELKQEARLDAYGQTTLEYQMTWPESLGRYTLEAELRGADGQQVRSVREVEIIDVRSFGLAYKKPVTVSSSHAAEYLPANAVDGDITTFWSSTFADPAWLAVDLGEVRSIRSIRITWQDAYAKEFAIQVSSDGETWKDAFKEEDGKGGVSEIKLEPLQASRIRIYCTKRGTQWGHAIREFEIFE